MELMVIALLLVSAVHSQVEEQRSIGRHPCTPHSQPWQAYVSDGHRNCGGTLINPGWVVTSVICYSRNTVVRLGKHNLRVQERTEQSRKVVKAIPHPQFNRRTLDNDIILLKLDRRVPVSQYIRPLRLPSGCSPDGTQCHVSGWGSSQAFLSDSLRCANVQIINRQRCEASYRRTLTSNMICAGVQQGAVGSCKGDGGGPLVCNEQLEGIISWSTTPCTRSGYPGVYTKVCNYSNWIRDVIRKN